MARPKQKADGTFEDRRVAAVVLKDTTEYRDWLTSLSEQTLIPVATIVRDALAKWAADRGLPGPRSGRTRSKRGGGDRRRRGDEGGASGPAKSRPGRGID